MLWECEALEIRTEFHVTRWCEVETMAAHSTVRLCLWGLSLTKYVPQLTTLPCPN